MSDCVSTYKCAKCVKALQGIRGENTPSQNLHFSSALLLPKIVVSPGKELILPDVGDSDSLGGQLEMVRLNGVSTHNLVENLVESVLKLP